MNDLADSILTQAPIFAIGVAIIAWGAYLLRKQSQVEAERVGSLRDQLNELYAGELKAEKVQAENEYFRAAVKRINGVASYTVEEVREAFGIVATPPAPESSVVSFVDPTPSVTVEHASAPMVGFVGCYGCGADKHIEKDCVYCGSKRNQ